MKITTQAFSFDSGDDVSECNSILFEHMALVDQLLFINNEAVVARFLFMIASTS